MKRIRVLIAVGEEVFREGLVKLLRDQPSFEVVHQCDGAEEAVGMSAGVKPDITLIDREIVGFDALETTRQIRKRSPEVRVVIIARPDADFNPVSALRAGARACLAKDISAGNLLKSLELVSSGRIIISPVFAERFLAEITLPEEDEAQAAQTKPALSARELDIAKLIATGASNREMATKLFISESTVKVHVKNILNKLELRNRQQLAVYAVLKNWVTAETDSQEGVNHNR